MGLRAKNANAIPGGVMLWLAPNGEVEVAERRPSERCLPAWTMMRPAEAETLLEKATRRVGHKRAYVPRVREDDAEVLANDLARTGDEAALALAQFGVEVERRVINLRKGVPSGFCPRCEVNPLRPEQARNSLSRRDNATRICARCGEEEALEDYEKELQEQPAGTPWKVYLCNGCERSWPEEGWPGNRGEIIEHEQATNHTVAETFWKKRKQFAKDYPNSKRWD